MKHANVAPIYQYINGSEINLGKKKSKKVLIDLGELHFIP